MVKSTNQLNEIIKSFSKENANSSISQLAAIIDLCSKSGIRFSYDENYKKVLATYTALKYPEWNMEVMNREIESLASQGKFEEAAIRRDELISIMNEIRRQFRVEQYGTEDWFIENSKCEIFFIPTEIAVIDSLVNPKVHEK